MPFIRVSAGGWIDQASEADALLSYYESGLPSVGGMLVLMSTAAPAALERGRTWDRAGEPEPAVRRSRARAEAVHSRRDGLLPGRRLQIAGKKEERVLMRTLALPSEGGHSQEAMVFWRARREHVDTG